MSLFKRPAAHYGKTPQPETPYQKAAQVWDERIGSARVQARNWRFMAFGSLILSAGFAAALIWQSTRGTVVPWVVQVDKLGQAQTVAAATADYRPTDPQVAWHLARFITHVRSVSTDPVLVKTNWLAAYDFATDRAAIFLNEYARSNDPFAGIGQRSVSVQVTSVVRASDSSFQVKWTESIYERGGLAKTEHWTAMLTVVMQPPKTADALRKNPLGLFVNAIDWARELDGQPSQPRDASSSREPPPFSPTISNAVPVASEPTPSITPSTSEKKGNHP